MHLVDQCLKKPILVFVMAASIICLGLFATGQLPLAVVPIPQSHNVLVTVSYPGASPSTVQKEITSKLVNALQAVEDVKLIQSYSKVGVSGINIELRKINELTRLQRMASINQIVASTSLPSQADQPVVKQGSGMNDLVDLILTSKTASALGLLDFYNAHLNMALAKIPGVNNIDIDSDVQTPIIRIKVNPLKLHKYHLNFSDIYTTLNNLNQNLPAGSLNIHRQAYVLNIHSKTKSIPAIENLIIANAASSAKPSNGRVIRIRDIAEVSYESIDLLPLSRSRVGDQHVLGIELNSTGHSNPIAISHLVQQVVSDAKQKLPPDMHIKTIYDNGDLIHLAIMEVVSTIAIAAILVILICLLFLGRLRNTLIPVVTIPICLLGTMACLLLFSFSINMFTLLAMVVAIGLVVDDAIVVVEHVTSYIEQGWRVDQAVSQGAKEIALTIVGITLTLVAVYIPTLFMTTTFALWYQQFTVTLAVCVLISGILALTLAPLMCHYILSDQGENAYQRFFHRQLDKTLKVYHYLLAHVLRYQKTTLLVIALLIMLGVHYCLQLPRSILAKDPSISVMATVHPSPSDTVDSLLAKMQKQFANFLPHDKRITYRYFTTTIDPDTGVLSGMFRALSKPEYVKDIPSLATQLNNYIKQHTQLNASAVEHDFFGFGNHGDISLIIQHQQPLKALATAKRIAKQLRQSPLFLSVDVNSSPYMPQYDIQLNPARVLKTGLALASVRNELSMLLGGIKLNTDLSINAQNVPIYLQLAPHFLQTPNVLQYLTMRNQQGQDVSLDTVANLKLNAEPTVITAVNNIPNVEVDMTLAPHASISNALPLINRTFKQYASNASYRYIGLVTDYFENNHNAIMVFLFGILAVYLTLVLLFNSLIDPFIILFTVPFSLIGGGLSLYAIHGTVNIITIIALITLVGLITKHGVLIVQFANLELGKGLPLKQAILTAAGHRFRPIMMTTLAMVAGSLPLIFASGMGYVMRMQLGTVLFSGLLIGTLFSLFLVPLVYLIIKRLSQ